MAKAILNPAIKALRGKVGGWVYRWLKDPRLKAACQRKAVAGDMVFGVAMHVRHQRRAQD